MRRLFPLLLLLSALLPGSASAAEPFLVSNTENSGAGSLRAAIEAAGLRPGGDTITIGATGTIELDFALPVVTEDVRIDGPGPAELTIEPAAATGFRIFSFTDGVTASVSGLTVKGGTGRQGGGIRNGTGALTLDRVAVLDNEARDETGTEVDAEGGGVFSEGPLTMRDSVIRGNRATAISGGMSTFAEGAGVMAGAALTIERSTVSGNVAEAHGEGGKHSGALGGGLRLTGGPATVTLSTFSGNSAKADNSLTNEARGGGLQGSALTLSGSTVTGNSLVANGGAVGANLELDSATLLRDTIVSDPIGDSSSCGEALQSGGFNLDEDESCGLDESSDLVGVTAGLDPVLRDNGGPTPTHALLPGSIAIDRGNAFGSAVDQRGLPRPSDFPEISNSEGGDGSDIGAFELQMPAPSAGGPAVVSEQPTDKTPPNTRIVSGPPRNTYKTKAKFRFASTEAQSSFQCKLDKKAWRGCSNPFKRNVKPGKHAFKVRAIDRFGNVDPTPARFGWRVKPLS